MWGADLLMVAAWQVPYGLAKLVSCRVSDINGNSNSMVDKQFIFSKKVGFLQNSVSLIERNDYMK